jgi:hypothetical protein
MYAQFERDPDRHIELTPIVVFLAFAIESYVNSVGARQLAIWGELERLPWRKKIAILHKTAKRPIDWGRDPLQFATEVFALRDRLAHGKAERVVGPVFENRSDANTYSNNQELQPAWYSGITRDWALQAKERFRQLMLYLGGLFGLHESDYLHQAIGGVLIDDGSDA